MHFGYRARHTKVLSNEPHVQLARRQASTIFPCEENDGAEERLR